MENRDAVGRDYFHRIDPLKVDDADELELAYMLQNAAPYDPDLLKRLIERYADDLYLWMEVLLYYQQIVPPDRAQLLAFLQSVFTRAIGHAEQFHGQASAATWLFGIAYQVVSSHAIIDLAVRFAAKENRSRRAPARSTQYGWKDLIELPEKLRSALVLRYLFHLGLADIAAILSLQVSEIHQRLARARQLLLASSKGSDMEALLQAYLDGLYDDDPDGLSQIAEHVESCVDCQASIQQLVGLEKSLAESLDQRWKRQKLSPEQQAALFNLVLSKVHQAGDEPKLRVNLGQVAWIAGLTTLFLVLAVIFIRLTPAETEFPQAVITSTPPLPPVIDTPPELGIVQSGGMDSQVPQYIAPAFSADGSWGVFTLINVGTNSQADLLSSVELYNRQDNTIQVINKNASSLRIPWVYWDLAPSISGDGKYIVYVGATHDTSVTGASCATVGGQPCLDIFLYDRETGATSRLTQAWGGGVADGDSLAPTISQDGNWVAFWSAADNLVQENKNTCLPANPGATCLNIYLVDMHTGNIEQLPVGVIPGDVVFGVDRISLSADGRYVSFTASPSRHLARLSLPGFATTGSNGILTVNPSSEITQLGLPGAGSQTNSTGNPPIENPLPEIKQSSEAVVYDRQTGNYELENQVQDGTAGNGPSSTPVLSADGRYVAFVSASSNLVNGDENRYSDVFVRDRQTGAVELVSVGTNGQQGNEDSGITYWGRGFFSINISGDGRYVLLESAATNLAEGASNECNRFDIPACTLLYVHDRQTGKTEFISNLSLSVLSHFPEISADGRWVSFMQFSDLCLPTQNYCSNVMVYDRERGWMANLTRFGEQSSSLPWSYTTNLSLPWQAWESSALAFSPDSKLFAVGGFDAKVRIWRITNGVRSINQDQPDQILTTDGNDYFTTVAFSQDGNWLAAGTVKGLVDVWDLPSGKLLYTLKDQIDPIRKLEFTPDGAHLIFATLTETWIWSIGNGALTQEINVVYGSSAVFALDISAQGNILATARGDGTVWLQSLPSGELIGRLGGQQVTVDSLAFSSDGSLLAARSTQGRINLWKLADIGTDHPSFKLLSTVPSYMYVGALVFSPDNKYLASTGMIGEITLWSVPDGKLFTLSSSVTNQMVYGVAFSKAGDMLAVLFEDQVGLWSFPPGSVSTYFAQAKQDKYTDSLPPSTASDLVFSPNYGVEESLTIDHAAALSSFPLLVPAHMPENLSFYHASVNYDGSVALFYSSNGYRADPAMLVVYERRIDSPDPPTMTIGSSADVSSALVETLSGGVIADYVNGDWVLSLSISPPKIGEMVGTSREVWTWDDGNQSQRLRWQQNGILVALYYQVVQDYSPQISRNDPSGNVFHLSQIMAQSDLIQIANGMEWYSQSRGGLSYVPSGQIGTVPEPATGLPACGDMCGQADQKPTRRVSGGAIVTD